MIVLLLLYVQSVRSINHKFEIIQVDVSRLKPTLLDEKSPVLVYSKLVDARDLLKTTFKYKYISTYYDTSKSFINHVNVNKSKFLILHNKSNDDIYIDVFHGKTNDAFKKIGYVFENKHFSVVKDTVLQESVFSDTQRIKLPSDMVLILPSKWAYHVPMNISPETIVRIYMHDIIT